MPSCICCGERVTSDRTECPICGTKVPASALPVEDPATSPRVIDVPKDLPAGARFCASCATIYLSDHSERFCTCGAELVSNQQQPSSRAGPSAQTIANPAPPPERPPSGTRCLVLYGSNRHPLRYFPLQKEVTLIGRLDAVDGVFPDIDLSTDLDKDIARRVSRRHAVVLCSRATGAYTIRPLAGNTGTQIDADMVPAMKDYPLEPGRRIILGGAVRLKFEIV